MNLNSKEIELDENMRNGNQRSFGQSLGNSLTRIRCKAYNKRVHFATVEACHSDGNVPKCLNDEEKIDYTDINERRHQIWYSQKDYEEFLNDRNATIRMFRSLQGDMDEVLEDFYCLRGLEPFHSPALQSELRIHRAFYVDAVLSEQRRAKLRELSRQVLRGDENIDDGEHNCLANAIRHRIEHVSKWAMQRAQRLAVQDEIEAQKINGRKFRRRSSWDPMEECKRRRYDYGPFLPHVVSDNKKSFSLSSQVNLSELKEMNQRLLEEMGMKSIASTHLPQLPKSSQSAVDVMSLKTLMRARLTKAQHDLHLSLISLNNIHQHALVSEVTKDTGVCLPEEDALMRDT